MVTQNSPHPFSTLNHTPKGVLWTGSLKLEEESPAFLSQSLSFLQVVAVHRGTGESALVLALLSLCGDGQEAGSCSPLNGWPLLFQLLIPGKRSSSLLAAG